MANARQKNFAAYKSIVEGHTKKSFDGIGKPEALKYGDGNWSRRIDEKNRLVYNVSSENDIIIISCKGHYED